MFIKISNNKCSNSNNGLGRSDSKVIVIIIIIDNAIAMTVIDFTVIVYSSITGRIVCNLSLIHI